jgi:hypothetical protein
MRDHPEHGVGKCSRIQLRTFFVFFPSLFGRATAAPQLLGRFFNSFLHFRFHIHMLSVYFSFSLVLASFYKN